MKLAKYGLLVLLGCLIFAGCSKTTPICCVVMSENIAIKYVNKNGEDLLSPDQPHAITATDVELYYLNNGKKKPIPHAFRIGRSDSTASYKMVVWPNTPPDQNIGITYIAFESYPTDTLKVHYSNNNGVYVNKIWYNGELKWTTSQVKGRIITITKHLPVK